MGVSLTPRTGEPKTRACRSGKVPPILQVRGERPGPPAGRTGARRTGPAREEQP